MASAKRNGQTPARPAFSNFSMVSSEVVDGKVAAWLNTNPENTSRSPASPTEAPSTASITSLVSGIVDQPRAFYIEALP